MGLSPLEQPYAAQHIAQDTLSSEILLGNAACGMRLPLIVVRHHSDGRQRFVFRPESEETCSSGNNVAESRILRDHRTTSGEITGTTVAEPATAQTDVLILGHGELAAGGTDVLAVGAGFRQAHRGHNAPTMAAHVGSLIVTYTANSQLKRQGRTRRQVDEMLKFEMLTPIVGFVLPDNILASMLPVRDRGERRTRCRRSAGGPPIDTDWGPCWLPLEPFHWHTTIGSPKGFAIGKNVMMGGKGLNSRKVSGRHTNLIRHGIRFEIDQATHITVLGVQFLGPTEIEDSVCFAVEAVQAHHVAGSIALIGHARRAKDPAVVEPQTVHLPRQVCDIGVTLKRRPIRRWMVDQPIRILYIPHVKAQAPYTRQVMQDLPGHAAKRRRRQQPPQHNRDQFCWWILLRAEHALCLSGPLPLSVTSDRLPWRP